jgi:hypothetical protein
MCAKETLLSMGERKEEDVGPAVAENVNGAEGRKKEGEGGLKALPP